MSLTLEDGGKALLSAVSGGMDFSWLNSLSMDMAVSMAEGKEMMNAEVLPVSYTHLPTVTRIYNGARRKLADALVNGRGITISGGDVIVCEEMRPECVNEQYCCHRQQKIQ